MQLLNYSSALQLWPTLWPCFAVRDNFFPKELAVHVGKLVFLPLLLEEEQRHGLEVTCLPCKVNLVLWFPCPPIPWSFPCTARGASKFWVYFYVIFAAKYYGRGVVDEDCHICDSSWLAFGSVSEWKAVKRVSQQGLFPSRLPLNRLGLMAEEMTVWLVCKVNGIQALSVKSLFLIFSKVLEFSPMLIS